MIKVQLGKGVFAVSSGSGTNSDGEVETCFLAFEPVSELTDGEWHPDAVVIEFQTRDDVDTVITLLQKSKTLLPATGEMD